MSGLEVGRLTLVPLLFIETKDLTTDWLIGTIRTEDFITTDWLFIGFETY